MIVLITPTGARKDQFELCITWMKNQIYDGEVLWIIIDDAIPVTTDSVTEDFRGKWIIKKIYPTPKWTGQNTQSRNIKAGIDLMKSSFDLKNIEAIFIIEDDDYYKPVYLDRMMLWKRDYMVWGETNTIYYNVVHRKFLFCNNKAHASLFQTAFTVNALPRFEANLKHKFIDAGFWTGAPNKNLFFDNYLSVGIKGMPGRGGIGSGHTWLSSMQSDTGLIYLTKIIGENDRKQYERYYRGSSQPQHDILTKRRH